MAVFIVILALYVTAVVTFFISLLRWTIRSERECACGGAFEIVNFVHGPESCYPRAEALHTFS